MNAREECLTEQDRLSLVGFLSEVFEKQRRGNLTATECVGVLMDLIASIDRRELWKTRCWLEEGPLPSELLRGGGAFTWNRWEPTQPGEL